MERRTHDGRMFIVPDDYDNNSAMRMLIDSGVVELPSEKINGFRIREVNGEDIQLADRTPGDKE